VICASGLFAVETKGFTKPRDLDGRAAATVTFDGKTLKFPTRTTEEPLDQAARQAQWLAKWASSAVGEPVSVTPVLVLPGWFVERKGRGNTRHQRRRGQLDSLSNLSGPFGAACTANSSSGRTRMPHC
jgi:hypothetical protein